MDKCSTLSFKGMVLGGTLCFITSGTSPLPKFGLVQTELCNCRDSNCLVSLAQCLIHSRGVINNYQVNGHLPGEMAPVRSIRLRLEQKRVSQTLTSVGEESMTSYLLSEI